MGVAKDYDYSGPKWCAQQGETGVSGRGEAWAGEQCLLQKKSASKSLQRSGAVPVRCQRRALTLPGRTWAAVLHCYARHHAAPAGVAGQRARAAGCGGGRAGREQRGAKRDSQQTVRPRDLQCRHAGAPARQRKALSHSCLLGAIRSGYWNDLRVHAAFACFVADMQADVCAALLVSEHTCPAVHHRPDSKRGLQDAKALSQRGAAGHCARGAEGGSGRRPRLPHRIAASPWGWAHAVF